MNLAKFVLLLAAIVTGAKAGPLDNWHSRPVHRGTYIREVAFGAGVYVIVDGGRTITTRDLTKTTPDGTNVVGAWIDGIAYDGRRFVVVGQDGVSLVSTNGFNWEVGYGAGAKYRVIYANGTFVAAGTDGVAVSVNGKSWTRGNLPQGTRLRDIAFGNGVFVVDNYLSADGINWERANGTNGFYAIGFGNGKFVAIRVGSGPNILTSLDGKNWVAHGRLETIIRAGGIAYGNGYFVTAGGGGRAYSSDGISWTVLPSATTEYSVRFLNGRFVAGGYKTLYESDPIVQMRMSRAGSLAVDGRPGTSYRIEVRDGFGANAGWRLQEEVTLGAERTSGVFAADTNGVMRFYRAVVGP